MPPTIGEEDRMRCSIEHAQDVRVNRVLFRKHTSEPYLERQDGKEPSLSCEYRRGVESCASRSLGSTLHHKCVRTSLE